MIILFYNMRGLRGAPKLEALYRILDFKKQKVVLAANINDHEREGKRSMVVVYFAIQTSKVEDQDFAL